jgi:hypothetical protein
MNPAFTLSAIRRRDRRRIIREWALHRQDGIFGTDTAVFLSLSQATLFLFLSLLFSFVLTSPDAAEDG